MTFVRPRAPLLMTVLALACERSPTPPPPASSAAEPAQRAVSSAPPASVSAASASAPPSCSDWTLNDSSAKGSLEHWCQQFGPCPQNLQQAIARAPRTSFPGIEARGKRHVFRSGFLGGRSYTFDSGRLVAAEAWDDGPFGSCSARGVVRYYTAVPEAPASEPATSCSVVPGRDYTNGEPCRCDVKARQPTLVNGNRGPLLRTSLQCLYEVGVGAHLCQPTLLEQRKRMANQHEEARRQAEFGAGAQSVFRSTEITECGGTVISSPYQEATAACRYDVEGMLTGLRWGKRYESEGFGACER